MAKQEIAAGNTEQGAVADQQIGDHRQSERGDRAVNPVSRGGAKAGH